LRSNQPHKMGVGKGTLGPIQPNSQKWKSYFDKKQIAALEEIAGASLCANGYEIMYEKGDKNPSSIQKILWKWRDGLRQFYDKSLRKLTGKSEKIPWSRILNRVLTSIKQSRTNRF